MTPAERAVAHVCRRAEATREDARARIAHLLERAHEPRDTAEGLAAMMRRAAVTLNFHPDRRRTDGLTVVEGMLADGEYKSSPSPPFSIAVAPPRSRPERMRRQTAHPGGPSTITSRLRSTAGSISAKTFRLS